MKTVTLGIAQVLIGLSLIVSNGVAQQKWSTSAGWVTPAFTNDSLEKFSVVFTRSFQAGNDIGKSVFYITSHGIYQAEINGKPVGAAYFAPGFTSYRHHLQYQVYRVSQLLRPGRNVIRVTVAGGWYSGIYGGDMLDHRYGKDLSLLANLVLTYRNGRSESLVTDSSWRCSRGAVRKADFYGGEMYDSRVKTGDGERVLVSNYSKDNLVTTIGAPVTRHEQFPARRILITSKGEQVIDFGQNLAGVVRFKVRGKRGDTVRISHAESLDRDGNFYTGNLRSAAAEDVYILDGNGLQTFEPHFTYHGFRYIRVTGYPGLLKKENFRAIALYSDLPQSGTFRCSDPLINQLQSNIVWSQKSNFVDIPTDCPQRSERYGWTGDAQVFCRTAAFNRDVKNFFTKWLADLAADQGSNGGVPNIVPDFRDPANGKIKGGVAGWGDAATIIPWTLYEVYGDKPILRRQYASMKAWVDYIRNVSPGDLWTANGYGDWYAQGDSTSLRYIDQCFYAHSVELLLRAARVLRYGQDIKIYSELLERVKGAFLRNYSLGKTRATSTQTAFVLALQFDLLPDSLRQNAADRLVQRVHENHDHLATGFLGTPYLLNVLSRYGHTDIAYTLLNQKTMPSWLYPITKGATTIWEKWGAIRPDGSMDTCSLNHYAYGAVGDWLYSNVAGIHAAAPGYKKMVIRPEPGGGLTWVKASYRCRYGLIISDWKVNGKRLFMRVTIPNHTTATIFIPGTGKKYVGPGTYRFISKM